MRIFPSLNQLPIDTQLRLLHAQSHDHFFTLSFVDDSDINSQKLLWSITTRDIDVLEAAVRMGYNNCVSMRLGTHAERQTYDWFLDSYSSFHCNYYPDCGASIKALLGVYASEPMKASDLR